jgi:hypothetical protein
MYSLFLQSSHSNLTKASRANKKESCSAESKEECVDVRRMCGCNGKCAGVVMMKRKISMRPTLNCSESMNNRNQSISATPIYL